MSRALFAEGELSLTGENLTYVIVAAAVALVALGFAAGLVRTVLATGKGTQKMQDIAGAVQEGATAYLMRQFKTLGVFVIIAVLLLFLLPVNEGGAGVKIGRSVFFVVGALFSAFIGGAGMSLATRANLRVAAAANTGEGSRERAMGIAFRTGGVVGFLTVGLGLLGAAVVVLVYKGDAPTVLEGFGFGAALLAMFMRVGGGIFAKAAFGEQGLVFPLIVPTIGVLTAIIGVFITRLRRSDRTGLTAINRAFYISAAISAILVAIAALAYLPDTFGGLTNSPLADQTRNPQVVAIVAVIIGIALAAVIQALTGYFTEPGRRPVQDIGRTSLTGPATVILSGVSVGFESAVYSALVIAAGVYGAFLLGGGSIVLSLFAVALAGTGLLTTVGVIVAMDTFGPISDNAQGIAEMSGDIDEAGARVLTDLDAVGNTTKAITKGIAIATAVLAATALFGSYTDTVGAALNKAGTATDRLAGVLADTLNLSNPRSLVGLIIGAAVVFLFSGLAINAVSRSAGAVVYEVRRQFREFPGIMDGTQRPEYGKVVDICTRDAQRELITPGLLAVMAPIAVGFGLGVGALAAFLAGAVSTGVLMALFLANSGGAWDNAKKLVEEGKYGGKGSPAHAATVIGDTVGDPFKDTAGPAINPLMKVMNLVSLLIAPAVVLWSTGSSKNTPLRVTIAVVAGDRKSVV